MVMKASRAEEDTEIQQIQVSPEPGVTFFTFEEPLNCELALLLQKRGGRKVTSSTGLKLVMFEGKLSHVQMGLICELFNLCEQDFEMEVLDARADARRIAVLREQIDQTY